MVTLHARLPDAHLLGLHSAAVSGLMLLISPPDVTEGCRWYCLADVCGAVPDGDVVLVDVGAGSLTMTGDRTEDCRDAHPPTPTQDKTGAHELMGICRVVAFSDEDPRRLLEPTLHV
jgi:hypothetical protein